LIPFNKFNNEKKKLQSYLRRIPIGIAAEVVDGALVHGGGADEADGVGDLWLCCR
jgi:hypothetical protein